MKTVNDQISAMLTKLSGKSFNTDKQEGKKNLSYKISTYEDHMDKVITNKNLQPLPLHIDNKKDEKA